MCMQSTNSALQRKESAHNLGRAAGELLTSVSQQPSYLSLFCQIWNEGDSSSRRIRSPLKYRTRGCGTRAITIRFVSNPSRLVRSRTERSWARSTAPRMLPFGETRFGFVLRSGNLVTFLTNDGAHRNMRYTKFFFSCDTEHSAKKLASMRSQWCARCHRCSIISLAGFFTLGTF